MLTFKIFTIACSAFSAFLHCLLLMTPNFLFIFWSILRAALLSFLLIMLFSKMPFSGKFFWVFPDQFWVLQTSYFPRIFQTETDARSKIEELKLHLSEKSATKDQARWIWLGSRRVTTGSKVFQHSKDNNMLTFSSGQNSVFASPSHWIPGSLTIGTLCVDDVNLIFQPTTIKSPPLSIHLCLYLYLTGYWSQ